MGTGTFRTRKNATAGAQPLIDPAAEVGVRTPPQVSETARVSESSIETWPGLSLRPLTLRFSIAYYTSAVLTGLPLLVADLLGVFLANAAIIAMVNAVGGADSAFVPITILPLLLLLAQPVIGLFLGLLPGVGLSSAEEVRRASAASTVWAGSLFCMSHVGTGHHPALPITLALTWLLALVTVPTLRWLARFVASSQPWWGQGAIIFGGGPEGAAVYRRLLANPMRGLRPVGIIEDLHLQWDDRFIDPRWYLGPPAEATEIAEEHSVFWGIVAPVERTADELSELLDGHAATIPHLLVLLDSDSELRSWAGASDCGGLSSLRIDECLLVPSSQWCKRIIDILLTVCGGLLLLPFFAGVAIAIKTSSPGPVFFTQQRVGRNGRTFRMWKFRSMVTNGDQVLAEYLEKQPQERQRWNEISKLKRDPRVTRIGRLLRSTSLDELPQIWNVLLGDMSLVGPRALALYDVPRHGPAYALYTRMRPGMTGLWQVSGRSNTTYEEHVRLDLQYIRNWSLWLDLFILVRTVKVVLLREGAY